MAPFMPHAAALHDGLPARLLTLAGVIAAIYLGRSILAPLALALLLTIAAVPMVTWFERLRVPRLAAALLVMMLLLALVAGLLYLIVSQALSLAFALPGYETVLRAKLQSLSEGSGPFDALIRLLDRLGAVFPQGAPATTVVMQGRDPFETIFAIAVVVLGPLATFAMTFLLMTFILVQREDIRDRALRLAGLHDLHRTTVAMADATGRLGRYLLMQALVNGIYGAVMAIGFWFIGVPNAPLWGVLAFILRFIPYLGVPLSLLFPLLVAFATTEGWSTVFQVLALYPVVGITISYGLEPWLYGHSTGATPIAMVLSSAFWAVLWGPLGLVLAPALTACLVILGRHLPALSFLDVMLGDSPPLQPEARFYQRLLAEDQRGAARLLAAESERTSAIAAVERLVLPAIAQVSHTRTEENFGPGLAIRTARTLTRVMEGADEPLTGPADVLVLPMAGALDRAAAEAVLVALQDAGIATTADQACAAEAVLLVLVAAGEVSPHRLIRRVAAARALAPKVVVFVATEEGQGALVAAGNGLAWTDTLTGLLGQVERARAPATA